MTNIAASVSGIVHDRPSGRRDGRHGPGSAASFSATLTGLLDRALSDDGGRGGTGATVEMFNEHGFFAHGNAAERRDRPSVASDTPPTTLPPQIPEHPIDPLPAEEERLGPARGGRTIVSDLAATGVPIRAQPSAAKTATAVPDMAMPALATAKTVRPPATDPAKPAPLSGARPRATVPQATSRLDVSIDHGANGIAISVTTDAEDAIDDAGVRKAVSRTLARHGLVLSELKIIRRAGADSRRG